MIAAATAPFSVEVAISGPSGVQHRQLTSVSDITIGRDPQCTLALPSKLISRIHVTVSFGAGGMQVRDSSRNGTLVGQQFLANAALNVAVNTPIKLGEFALQFRIADGAAAPAPLPPQQEQQAPELAALQPPAVQQPVQPAGVSHPAAEQQSKSGETPDSFNGAKSSGLQSRRRELVQSAEREQGIELRRQIHSMLLEHLDMGSVSASALDDPSLRPKILTALRRIVLMLDERIPKEIDRDALIGEMVDEALGLGPLEMLLSDPTISEIMVVDPNTIYVEKGGKLVRSGARFTDDERVRAIIERIVTPLGRRIDESSPLVDARLKDGSRVNAVIRPLALRGSAITIRKFSKNPLTLKNLIDFGALTEGMGRFLTRSVKAKKNVVIAGGTGSGKTTLLNVLSAAIPTDERIVTIEDAAELQLNQPHVVSLETRPANMEGKGEYSIRDLVKNALRMRPDRIVVGECRGGEALDMLQAMNTGHDGSLTTTHANSPREALARLETLVLMSGLELPVRAVREQIAGAVHVLVQQSRLSDGSRRVTAINEVTGVNDEGDIETVPIFRFVRTGTDANGKVKGEFRATGFLPTFLNEFLIMGFIKEGDRFL